MPKAGEENGMVIFRDDEVAASGIVHRPLVVHVHIAAQHLYLPVGGHAAVIDGNELLVQVLKGGAGWLQPVLEGHHIGCVAVALVEVPHGIDSQLHKEQVLFGA